MAEERKKQSFGEALSFEGRMRRAGFSEKRIKKVTGQRKKKPSPTLVEKTKRRMYELAHGEKAYADKYSGVAELAARRRKRRRGSLR